MALTKVKGSVWTMNDNLKKVTATANDVTPSVDETDVLVTNNTSATVVTTLDDGIPGQSVLVLINDALTTFDFSGTVLKGNNGIDKTFTSGDSILATYDGTNWHCLIIENTKSPQVLSGAGAVDTVSEVTHLVTTGANAITLADGVEGQVKYIVMKTDGGDGTLTPTSLGNGTTITFNDVGDSATLYFTNSAWHYMGGTATLA